MSWPGWRDCSAMPGLRSAHVRAVPSAQDAAPCRDRPAPAPPYRGRCVVDARSQLAAAAPGAHAAVGVLGERRLEHPNGPNSLKAGAGARLRKTSFARLLRRDPHLQVAEPAEFRRACRARRRRSEWRSALSAARASAERPRLGVQYSSCSPAGRWRSFYGPRAAASRRAACSGRQLRCTTASRRSSSRAFKRAVTTVKFAIT